MTDKKEKIFNAAIALFESEGLSVTTARIAKEAGVSNGTLFNYYSTKQELIDTVYIDIKSEVAEAILTGLNPEDAPKDIFHAMWQGYIHWALDNIQKHNVCNLLKTSQMLGEEACELVDGIFQIAHDSSEKGLLSKEIKEIPIKYLCDLACAQMAVAIDYAETENLQGDALTALINLSYDIHWNGVKR
jgi:AcrR family transcriptional regulator